MHLDPQSPLLKDVKVCHFSPPSRLSVCISLVFCVPQPSFKELFARDLVVFKLPFICCWIASYSPPSLGSDIRCDAYYMVRWMWKIPSQNIWGSEKDRELCLVLKWDPLEMTEREKGFNLKELK